MKYSISVLKSIMLFLVVVTLNSCQKEPSLPVLSTITVTGITGTTAISGGNITSDGGAAITARGVCWGTTVNPTTSNSKTVDGTGTGQYVSNITGITAGTLYHLRAYATNSAGTAYGANIQFTTLDIPVIGTTPSIAISNNAATCGGNITSDGGASITARGICWSTSSNPTIANNITNNGTGTGTFNSTVTNLTAGTVYHARAYATNSVGTAYGNEISFTATNPLTDIDGNVYNTVTIGTQLWMAENLKTTKYNDGTSIPYAANDTEWQTITVREPKYCWYNYDIANKADYGALYKWYTVGTGKLCPAGWHVPTDSEWNTLVVYLGGNGVAGGKMKESGTNHWNSPNSGATNEALFTALPAGFCDNLGVFRNIGVFGTYWSSTEIDLYSNAGAWGLSTNDTYFGGGIGWEPLGFSVRCVKD